MERGPVREVADPGRTPPPTHSVASGTCSGSLTDLVSLRARTEPKRSRGKLEGPELQGPADQRRGFGRHHSAAALIAVIYLCAGGITVSLLTQS
jgi:hypothetical protein